MRSYTFVPTGSSRAVLLQGEKFALLITPHECRFVTLCCFDKLAYEWVDDAFTSERVRHWICDSCEERVNFISSYTGRTYFTVGSAGVADDFIQLVDHFLQEQVGSLQSLLDANQLAEAVNHSAGELRLKLNGVRAKT